MSSTTENGLGPKRLDIQALRALAVVSVLLFHFDLPGVPGGYLGVDIFFVVSGFLITRILDREVVSGGINILEFYTRRVRRILPAAVATIAVTLAVATVLFASVDLAPAARSALAALLSSSNILFWLESGYFDASSDLKPLLHTWSLGVEEQFYLVWPTVILVAARYGRRALVVALVVLGLASLIAAQMLLSEAPNAVFYLMPFRAFEFAIGGLLSFVRPLPPGRLTTILFACGWAMMLVSVAWFGENYPMPGVLSLVPAGGAGLAILTGAGAPRWLLVRPMVATGDLSYSLYLVHWPLVVFWKYKFGLPSLAPLRSSFFLLAASSWLGCSIVLLSGRCVVPSSGMERYQPPVRSPGWCCLSLSLSQRRAYWAADGMVFKRERLNFHGGALKGQRQVFLAEILQNSHVSTHGPRIVIIGDSHAQDVLSALYQAA